MKNNLYILLIIILATGCIKQLDQMPKDTATQNVVFNSKEGLELYANSFYNMLPFGNSIYAGDNMSDFFARTQAPDFLIAGGFDSRSSSGWDWNDLRNINYYLENLNKSTVDPLIVNNYRGIARFFRAWFYFEKMKRFGNVPWINKPLPMGDSALFAGRDERTLITDSIIADLNYACANIAANVDGSRSLISKTVAYGFLSRVCLFEGTFRKYHTQYNLTNTVADLLTKAVNAAQTVITGSGNAYSIFNGSGSDKSYRQLFSDLKPVTQEVMLAAVVDPTLAVYHDANWSLTSSTYGSRLSFTRTFINTYLNIDGTPFTANPAYRTMTFMEETKNRDLRLQQTIRTPGYARLNGNTMEQTPPVFSYTYTGYQPIKFTLDDYYYDGGSRNINSMPIMRYAEILLNYAEAKAELGTLTDADWNITVGALRRRAGITGNTATKPSAIDTYLQTNYFPTISDPSLLEIRRERGIELAMEGFRFYDLVRWKLGNLLTKPWNGFYVPALDTPMDLNQDGKPDVVFYTTAPATQVKGITYINVAPNLSNGPNPQRLSNGTSGELTWLTNVTRTFVDKQYLYPIPENDYQNNKKLGQNPGW